MHRPSDMAPRKQKGKKQLVTKEYLHSALSRAIETKYWYNTGTESPSYDGSLVGLTNNISQGDAGVGTRDGDRFTPVYLHMKGHVTLADTTNLVRILIIRWREDYADLTSVGQILETTGSTLAPTSMFVKEPDQRRRFEVVADRLFNLHTYEPVKTFDIRVSAKKLKSKPVQAIAGAAGGLNQLVGLVISDSAAVTHPSIDYEVVIKYKDA